MKDMTFLRSQVGMGSNRHVDSFVVALLMVEVSSERSTGEKQSRVRPGPKGVTDTDETSTAVGGWAWFISSLILVIFPVKMMNDE